MEEKILKLTAKDLAELVALERLCFATPWTEKQFRLCLAQDHLYVLGLKSGGRLLAYISFFLVGEEMEILNLAVHPKKRRQGLGTKLLCTALNFFRRKNGKKVFLEVRPSNVAALNLYKRAGFIQAGLRKNYYPDNGEDALVMVLKITNRSI
ncbi:ribosomal protein S18-alanine N-acetyltransferase [Desulfohalobiaceae bacterium Ax17]|uniref:ribosomal protein S18-alanine N-acetyltransferase n=1 Tax=Desulfovulcanus ferrireducens TaxID=2831190 RepID=UPI00207BCD0B|nr:ribosomal protein S18-alanine N-acetyltransferase [Desulfovulcanus ferrireducens]MBT8763416.1 ribosomal protein S18-alanine N-acetyltransferase [Desulfovulcanus ferrireducens]